jgi:nickel/cobalt transporter (NicO) family protein
LAYSFISIIGLQLSQHLERFTSLIAPILLIIIGLFFIWQHHRHQHFELNQLAEQKRSKQGIIGALLVAMFLSPCFEIEAYYLLAGAEGWGLVIFISVLYLTVTISGMLLWVRLVYKSLVKLNWHSIENNAGIITGCTLIGTGVLSFLIH